MKQTIKMANKKFVMGMLAMALTFGLSAAVYGQSLNGTWVPEFDGEEDDAELAFLALINADLTLKNGKFDSRFIRGTYTVKNNQITITITHWSKMMLTMFLEFDDDDDDLFSSTHQSEWYSKEQLKAFLLSMEAASAEELKEILDQMYPTKTTPIIGGKKFTLPVLDTVFVKK